VEHARRMLDQQWTADELAAEPWLTRALARLGWPLPWALRFACLVVVGGVAFFLYWVAEASTGNASDAFVLGGGCGWVAALVFALGLVIIVESLDKQRVRRLGPRRDVGRAAFGKLTMDVWAGVACNFVAPIGIGLGPWAVVLVCDFARGQDSGTYIAYVVDIVFGPLVLGCIAVIANHISFSEMDARAEFMIRVARLAQRSAMLDVAERCLRDCLELCARYGGTAYALEANARLVALLVQSGRMAAATPHESAVRDLCATQLTGWRGFLRRYVAFKAPRSLFGLAIASANYTDLGAAYAMAELHAGLQHADETVAELTKACEMGLVWSGIVDDELFEVVRLEKPEEFAVLCARIAENVRKWRRALVWRRLLGVLIVLGLLGSLISALVELWFGNG
jgi:hypothetical protein